MLLIIRYCGHGDGCHFANGGANGAGVEGAAGARALVLLSGCGSVRLRAIRIRYCGHGDGCHFANGSANGAGVEGAAGARALVLLSGCGSGYCGHGDGCHFANGGANGAGVEGAAGARALVLLSGCGSVRLARPPGRAPPAAAHHHLHIAGSPMVVGMLWEVTDLEVDKMVSTLMSLYVPSNAPVPWPSVGKAKWSQGVLDIEVEQKTQFVPERNLLRAISRARGSTGFVMIASAMVARGLPVRVT
ncbi:uncharacterized protein LOC135082497 [Ostrinia nubilalis]|uniref:uncharacterized protein LOC135082497 n=1 Tax=Ostrinia nubilalis TaxID=29057 RepID=UPI0030824114